MTRTTQILDPNRTIASQTTLDQRNQIWGNYNNVASKNFSGIHLQSNPTQSGNPLFDIPGITKPYGLGEIPKIDGKQYGFSQERPVNQSNALATKNPNIKKELNDKKLNDELYRSDSNAYGPGNVQEGENQNKEDHRSFFMKLGEILGGDKRAKEKINKYNNYIQEKYPENEHAIKSIIYEEQAHLSPREAMGIDGNTVGLGQITYSPKEKDKNYFGYKSYDRNYVLDDTNNIDLMNEKINIIKHKLRSEGKPTTLENIAKGWNGGPECVKQNGNCIDHAIDYGKRVVENSYGQIKKITFK